jgi:hypothetical protein
MEDGRHEDSLAANVDYAFVCYLGLAIFYNNAFAFVTFNGGAKTLALFDRAGRKFVQPAVLSTEQQMLSVCGNVVIEPDFLKVEVRRPSSEDTSAIFILGREAYGVLPGTMLFNMGIGDVTSDEKRPMAACASWRLGVKDDTSHEPRWLIKVPAGHG